MKNIEVNISNTRDLKKFYRKLKFYKLFHRNKYLKLSIKKPIDKMDAYNLTTVVKAFNIKDKDERLNYVYDEICSYQDKLFIDKNICEFDDNGLCIVQREYHHPSKINGCCGLCTYLGKKGCTIKSIACKTFYCSYIIKKKQIPSIKKNMLYKYFLSIPQKEIALVNFWNTKEENIKIMKKNSIIYNFFKKRKKMKRW